jgi:hypothetical protein
MSNDKELPYGFLTCIFGIGLFALVMGGLTLSGLGGGLLALGSGIVAIGCAALMEPDR